MPDKPLITEEELTDILLAKMPDVSASFGEARALAHAHQDIPYLLALAAAAEQMEEALESYAQCGDGCTCGDGWDHDAAEVALSAYHRAREGQ